MEMLSIAQISERAGLSESSIYTYLEMVSMENITIHSRGNRKFYSANILLKIAEIKKEIELRKSERVSSLNAKRKEFPKPRLKANTDKPVVTMPEVISKFEIDEHSLNYIVYFKKATEKIANVKINRTDKCTISFTATMGIMLRVNGLTFEIGHNNINKINYAISGDEFLDSDGGAIVEVSKKGELCGCREVCDFLRSYLNIIN